MARNRIFVTLLIFLAGARYANTQVGNLCAIVGTVRDASGALVAGATVRITDEATNISREQTSSNEGFFAIEALPSGDYTAKILKDGFTWTLIRNIHLDPGERRTVDVKLQVGKANFEVTVEADTVTVQTESSESSGTISAKEVSNLMLNGRNFQSLTQIVPGVSNILGASQLSGNGETVLNTVIVNGASVENTAFSLDGIYDTVPQRSSRLMSCRSSIPFQKFAFSRLTTVRNTGWPVLGRFWSKPSPGVMSSTVRLTTIFAMTALQRGTISKSGLRPYTRIFLGTRSVVRFKFRTSTIRREVKRPIFLPPANGESAILRQLYPAGKCLHNPCGAVISVGTLSCRRAGLRSMPAAKPRWRRGGSIHPLVCYQGRMEW